MGALQVMGVQRSGPRCTLMLVERGEWLGPGFRYPSPSSCMLQE